MDTTLFRWVLAIIAVLFVIGIYLYGIHQSRRRKRDAIESHTREEIDSAFIEDEQLRDELDNLTQILRDNDIEDGLEAVEISSAAEPGAAPVAAAAVDLFVPDEFNSRPVDRMISYFLYRDDFRLITGEEAHAAAGHAELTVDNDGYLQYRNEDQVAFRVASLSEPGHFNEIDRLEFTTLGFNCFIDLDQSEDPPQAYEAMLRKIDELVRILNVKVYKSDRELLTISDVTEIRDRLGAEN